jgi:hypothetical protein
MLRFTISTLLFSAALVAAPTAFACGDDDKKDDKKEDSVLSVVNQPSVDNPSCGDDDKKDDKKDET